MRRTNGSTPSRSPSPARTPATQPFSVSRRYDCAVTLIRCSIIAPLGHSRDTAQHEDRAHGGGKRDGHPAEGQVEPTGGVHQHEGADDRDRGAGAQRENVDVQPVPHAPASAARWGAVFSWNGPGPKPGWSTSAVLLLMTRS